MKIALVHDFLKEYGGAERVLETLHEIWPKAPIYTAFVDFAGLGPHAKRLKNWKIITSWAQKIPLISKIYSPLRFLAPKFFESFNFKDFDVVISSTNAYYAKGIITSPKTIHICYCHTPPRSLYGYKTRMDWQKNLFTRIYGHLVNHYLRKYDFLAAQKVDYFIANSNEVRERIKKFYRRDSTVIYPPVELLSLRGDPSLTLGTSSAISSPSDKITTPAERGRNDNLREPYYLYVGKLAAAKNVHLVVGAAIKVGFRLKIVGKGGEEARLRELVSARGDIRSEVEFLGEVNDEELINLYVNCRAVIFPAADEDFGIVAVEAMSFGKPVIVYESGGVKETVIDGVTGVFFDPATIGGIVMAINRLKTLKINPQDCVDQAKKFGKETFKKKMNEFVLTHRSKKD